MKKKFKPVNPNPVDPLQFTERALWVIYGPDSFPSMICCMIKMFEGKPIIWGYSVYRNQPGFRTLGQNLDKWIADNSTYQAPKFFESQTDALQHICNLTLPRC